jgi:hypothetical protein
MYTEFSEKLKARGQLAVLGIYEMITFSWMLKEVL